MSFMEKEIEDEGMHYQWLLVASYVPKINERTANYSSMITIKGEVELIKYLVVIQQIMQRFAIAWHKVAYEEEGAFHKPFHETKLLNNSV